jgi:hypothetical protein
VLFSPTALVMPALKPPGELIKTVEPLNKPIEIAATKSSNINLLRTDDFIFLT